MSRAKGTYYKHRTKRWYEEHGYTCQLVERFERIITPEGRVIFHTTDVFGADGIAMNGKEVIYWNSKLGSKNIAEGFKQFNKWPWPPGNIKVVVQWEKRAREPIIHPVPDKMVELNNRPAPEEKFKLEGGQK